MKHVKVKSETYRDNSAKSINLPTLLIEYDGEVQVLEQLHKYQLKHKLKSSSWHNKLVQAVGLLLDYMEANQDNYTSAKDFFEIFTESIYEGTINEDGFDPSGLFWIPKRTETANMLLTALNGFSDWMHDEYGAAQLNPWREATSYEQRLNWMAQINKSHHSFLGHLNDVHEMTETAKQIRNVKNRRKPYSQHGGTKAFPEDQIHNLLWEGFKRTRKNMELNLIDRYNWRDIAITILMHGGGLRHSEVFHLWLQDVFADPDDPDCVFRKRDTTKYERDTKGLPDVVCELWSPVVSVALLTKLLLPLRTYQVRMLDSGEMDTFKYIQRTRTEHGHWIMNDSPLSKGDKDNPFEKGVLRKFNDPISKMEMTGFFVNTNKTADINKEEDQKGYEIPWQYEEAQYWLAKLRDWQQKYNPLSKPTPWVDLKVNHIGNFKDKKILKQMGSTMFLFRNPSSPREEHFPVGKDGLDTLWHKVLTELESRLKAHGASEEEKFIRFIKNKNTTLYPLHSLRVSLITAYALEGGVPMPILSKSIVGHARLVMTLYYTKAGISYVTDKMNQAEHNILENDKKSFERFLRDAKYEQLENNIAINDPIAYQTVINAQQSGASIIIGDKGICPKGNFGCESGGVFVNDDTGRTTYGPVPGFPQHNCVRCRWFVTGPAFLPGLVHHFNTIGYNMSETGKRVIHYQNEIETLENHKYECEVNEQIFTEQGKLLKFETLHMQEIQKNDKIANDYNAALRLIDKCIVLTKNSTSQESVQLVPVGSIDDIGLMINSADHELEQLQIICNGAEIFPETDASKAVLQRSQIIDLTLAENGKKPVMFSLTDEEQLIAGNQFMRLLMQRAGSLKNAVPYAIGRKKLEEIGLINEFVKEIESMKLNEEVLALDAATPNGRQIIIGG